MSLENRIPPELKPNVLDRRPDTTHMEGFPFDATEKTFTQAGGIDTPETPLGALGHKIEEAVTNAENGLAASSQEVQIFAFSKPKIENGRITGRDTQFFTGTETEYHEHIRQEILSKIKRNAS